MTTVSVVDGGGTVGALARHLPADWTIERIADLGTTMDIELLVVGGATGPAIAQARHWHPYAVIVGVIDQAAPADVIVDVLSAGADACVRSGSAAILAAHLRSLKRAERSGSARSSAR
jgi:hypothetical protein